MRPRTTAERYRSDPRFRERQKRRSRLLHFGKLPLITRPAADLVRTAYYADVPVRNPRDVRCGTTVRVPLCRIGTLAALLGVGLQTVRGWEREGVIPPPTLAVPSGRGELRVYTIDQVEAVRQLVPLLNLSSHRGPRHAPFARALREAWAAMPDGLRVKPAPEPPADGVG